tara:strand:- start:48 stop:260 length:213 start_codon:yes stop_codon:yes gene_type:complete
MIFFKILIKNKVMTLIEHLIKELKFIQEQIKRGKSPNRNNLDGYVMQGLENKERVLEECLFKLKHIYPQK